MTVFVFLAACVEPPREGTFVGNPTLLARYVDNADQVGVGGRLMSTETAFEPCAAPTIGIGAQDFEFDGTSASLRIELPEVDLCGIRMAISELAISVDDDGVAKTVVGQDFSLVVSAGSIPADAIELVLELGDEDWLPDFLPLAPPGETQLNSEADPALVQAFFDKLDANSSFVAEDAP